MKEVTDKGNLTDKLTKKVWTVARNLDVISLVNSGTVGATTLCVCVLARVCFCLWLCVCTCNELNNPCVRLQCWSLNYSRSSSKKIEWNIKNISLCAWQPAYWYSMKSQYTVQFRSKVSLNAEQGYQLKVIGGLSNLIWLASVPAWELSTNATSLQALFAHSKELRIAHSKNLVRSPSNWLFFFAVQWFFSMSALSDYFSSFVKPIPE